MRIFHRAKDLSVEYGPGQTAVLQLTLDQHMQQYCETVLPTLFAEARQDNLFRKTFITRPIRTLAISIGRQREDTSQ